MVIEKKPMSMSSLTFFMLEDGMNTLEFPWKDIYYTLLTANVIESENRFPYSTEV